MVVSISQYYRKDGDDDVAVVDGGTDASTSAAARTNLGVTVYDETTHDALTHSDIAGAVTGRADAGSVSGAQPIVRVIAGNGMSVALVEAGGELQFTLTGVGSIDQNATATGGPVTSLNVNPGFVPRIGFVVASKVVPAVSHTGSVGIFVGTGVQQQINLGVAFSITTGPTGAGAVVSAAAGVASPAWTCTSFTSSNVTISGGSTTLANMIVVGGG